ncbi:MAG: hypothetical protein KDA42_19065, partial [Planctomycetales bacterium]|nr:hypothetical protein [Planctomycetales bacterium]
MNSTPSNDATWFGSQSPAAGDHTPNILHGLWRRKSLVLLGTVVGLIVSALYFNQQETRYQASAEVLVVRKHPGSIGGVAGESVSMLGERDIPHEQLIKSPLIIDRAVKDGNLPSAESIGGSHDPGRAILRSLSVSYQSNMLRLAFEGPDPDACRQVLQAVIESYREFLDETYRNANEDTLRLVTQKAAEIKDELRKKGDEYQDFHKRTPLTWLGKGGGGVYEERLASIEKKRSEQRLVQAELRTRLEAMQAAVEGQKDEQYLRSMVASTPEFSQLERTNPTSETKAKPVVAEDQELLALMLRAETLAETYGPEYPDVRAVQRQIEMMQRFRGATEREMQVGESNAKNKTDSQHPVPAQDLIAEYIQLLEQQLDESERMEETLSKLYEQEHEAARKLSIYQFEDKRLSSDIERAEQFYSSLMSQLQSVDVGKDLGGYTTSVITPASRGARVNPNAMRIIPA